MNKNLAVFIALSTLTSCSDFLAEVSQSEMIPKTAEDFSQLLLGSGYPDQNGPSIAFLCLLDDDMEQLYSYSGENRNQYVECADAITYQPYYTWQVYESDLDGYGSKLSSSALQTTYYAFYEKIKGCNAVLDAIDEAQGAQVDKDRVKAEALGVRAMLYFELVNLYGQPYNYLKKKGLSAPGIPLKLDATLAEETMARASVDSVYESVIVPNLVEACRLMDPLPVKHKDYRINQPALHTLLSRVYLYMDRYEDCISEVNKAIQTGAVMLDMVNNLDAIKTSSTGSYEPISYNNPEVEWIFGPPTCFDNVCYGPGHGTEWRRMYNQRTDQRWKAFCLAYQGSLNYCYLAKPRGSGLGQCIRTSEAYLNRMEAMALAGKEAEALAELNDFRRLRITSYKDVTLQGDQLLSEIRTDRRKELCYEGHRWFDLRRQGMPQITHRYKYEKAGRVYLLTLQAEDPLYTLPLPSVLLEKNTALRLNPEHIALQNTERTGVAEIEEE